MTLNLQQLIHYFVEHRAEIIIRRTKYELAEAQKRAHILEGLLIALDHLDEVIKLIRGSRDPEVARGQLIERFKLSEVQARAILDMRLQRLTGLERDKIVAEYNELMKLIDYLKSVLESDVLAARHHQNRARRHPGALRRCPPHRNQLPGRRLLD